MSLLARSWTSPKRMILTLRESLAKRGLKLHPSKCKAQTNSAKATRRGTVPIDEDSALDVLPEGEGLKILGTVNASRCDGERNTEQGCGGMETILVNEEITCQPQDLGQAAS